MSLPPDEQYAANCGLLAGRMGEAWPVMRQQLAQAPLCNIQLGLTPAGSLYGQLYNADTKQWAALCDQADPLGQAAREVASFYTRDVRIWCLVGLGLGYIAAELAKRLQPHQRLCIWEADPTLWKATLHAVDIAPLIRADRRIDFHVGGDILGQVDEWWMGLETQEKFDLRFPLRANYTTIIQPQFYDALIDKTVNMLRMHAVGLATWQQFGGQIGTNDLVNLPEYLVSPGYEQLAGLWNNRPAVCLAAGPSLQKNLLQLVPYREQVAVISAGTVYALAQGMHLTPDIVTTIDFQLLNYTDQFKHVPIDPSCALVYLHSTHPQTPRRWPGPRFVAENSSGTLAWVHQYTEAKGSAAQVQTVAHLNLLVALMLGANPIILLGQDLSMPATQHHAVGARAQDQAPAEVAADAFVTVADMYGQPVATRHSFLSMKTVFERIIAAHPDRTIYQCSEAGLALAGATHAPLAHVLAGLAPDIHAPVSLRDRMATLAAQYQPKVHEQLVPDLEVLLTQMEEFADGMRALIADWEAIQQAEDETARAAVRASLLARQSVFGTYQRVFDLCTLRQFALVALLSAIPPETDTLTPAALEQLNCERVQKIAALVLPELPKIRRVLRRTIARLRPLCVADGASAVQLFTPVALLGLQHYDRAAQVAATLPPVEGLPLLFHTYANTHQYDAALALASVVPVSAARLAQVRRIQAQYAADMRVALPAYSASSVPSLVPPASPQCGFAIGA